MFEKVLFLLSKNQKKQLLILGIGLLFGVFFEMLGLGLLIPVLGLLLKATNFYSTLNPYFSFQGAITSRELITLGMSFIIIVYFIKSIFLIFLSWQQSKLSADLSADKSKRPFLGYLNQPYAFNLKRNSAELLRNIQSEVSQFHLFLLLYILCSKCYYIRFMLLGCNLLKYYYYVI